jgi:Glycosyl transferase family 2
MSAGGPVAAIVVPTHDHAATLDLSVGSALAQTIAEVEVVVVGDGVGDDTREVMAELTRGDSRVRFLDLPKGPHHGELHRGRAIAETAAGIVCYLCDDDLLLPDHVESMVELLERADLANSQNGHLDASGCWHHYFADLSFPPCRDWVLRPDRNVVSLTGTAHTAAAYRRLPHGWRTTPAGRFADHYMWQQFLAEPWVRAVTATRVTAVQFPSHVDGRESWPAEARRAELERWRAALATGEGRAGFEELVRRAVMDQTTGEFIRRDGLEAALAAAEAALAAAEDERARAAAHATGLTARLAGIESTRTWRLRNRLKRLPLAGADRPKGRWRL